MNKEEINKKIQKLDAELAELKAQVNKPETDEWPKDEDVYYSHTFRKTADNFIFTNCEIDKYRKSIGNMFHAKEQAERRFEQLKLIQELREFGGDEGKYHIWYGPISYGPISKDWQIAIGYSGLVQFPSIKKAIEAIEHFGDRLNILLPSND